MNEYIKLTNELKYILNSLLLGMLLVSPEGKLLFINKSAKKMLNIENINVNNFNFDNFVPNFKKIVMNLKKDSLSAEKCISINNSNFLLDLEISNITDLDKKLLGFCISIKRTSNFMPISKCSYSSKPKFTFDSIIGESPQMKNLISFSKKIAPTPSTVLITGASGCGKELLAQAIHNDSNVKDGPFVAINCGSIPKNLIESELFGYESGSFTGAKKQGCEGKFELANNGTIFLDEIGEMPLDMQTALLRVLQERSITRIGGKTHIPINVRVIAATNKNLKEEIKKGSFRQDLFYRLSVMPIKIPELKDRIGDIPILIDYFLKIKSQKLNKKIPHISNILYRKMLSYCWPGNVRELENCIENIVNLNGSTTYEIDFDECTCMDTDNLGNPIVNKDLYLHLKDNDTSNNIEDILPLKTLEENEIKKSIRICKGNISKAASLLGISRNTLYTKIKKYNIEI